MKKSRYREMMAERYRASRRRQSTWPGTVGVALTVAFLLIVALSGADRIAWAWHTPQYLTFGPLLIVGGLAAFYRRPVTPVRRRILIAVLILALLGTGGLFALRDSLSEVAPFKPTHPAGPAATSSA